MAIEQHGLALVVVDCIVVLVVDTVVGKVEGMVVGSMVVVDSIQPI